MKPPKLGAVVVEVVLVGAAASFDASLVGPPKRFGTAIGPWVKFQG